MRGESHGRIRSAAGSKEKEQKKKQKKRKARHFRAEPEPDRPSELLRSAASHRSMFPPTSRLCDRSCFGGQELPAACLEATVTGVASVDVTAVYRHPPASTSETLRRFLPPRVVPWLPDTHLFKGSPLADTSVTPWYLSHDQVLLPDLILPRLLIVWVSHLYFHLGLKDSPRTLGRSPGRRILPVKIRCR